MTKGIVYVVWGDKIKPLLERSMGSVLRFHPDLPTYVHWCEGSLGLRHKTELLKITPFNLTLYLDADTVVLAPLDRIFDQVWRHGIVCTIAECPWLRRYDGDKNISDAIEYSTGVLGFDRNNFKVKRVMTNWEEYVGSWQSRWVDETDSGILKGSKCDDQAGFGRAIEEYNFNPYVLPNNYNFHPGQIWDQVFLPIKIWHHPSPVPQWVIKENQRIEEGGEPVRFVRISQRTKWSTTTGHQFSFRRYYDDGERTYSGLPS